MLLLFDDAQELVKTYHCRQCGHKAMLVARAVPGDNRLNVVCGGCGSDEHLEQDKSLTQRWRENPDSVPIHTANKLAEKYGVEPMVASERALVPVEQQETAVVKRIDEARFLPDLKPHEKATLAHLAIKYDLDPLFGELTWYEGKPYISVGGYERIARKSGELRGLMCLPMTKEQREQWGPKYESALYAFICTVRVKDWPDPVIGTGTADPANPYRGNPVEKARPERMAKARAIRDALKQAFPHMLPRELHIADDVDERTGRAVVIDHDTGEIVDRPASTATTTAIDPEPIIAAEWRESELPLDSSDFPEPTALEEHAKAEAEFIDENRLASRRQELLDALRELAPRKWKGGWANLQAWWGSYFPNTPETADVATLEQAYARLTNTKAAGHGA